MSEPTPELRWAPIEPKPKKKGRVWLIIGLVVAGLAIIGTALFFLLPRGEAPVPGASPSATESGSQPPSPGQTPEVTPPAPVDPSIEVFREHVVGWLNDAPHGLDIIPGAKGDEALVVVDTLEQDARRLSDAQPPSSIDVQWRDGVAAYSQRLAELRTVIADGSDSSDAIEAASNAVQNLRSTAGL